MLQTTLKDRNVLRELYCILLAKSSNRLIATKVHLYKQHDAATKTKHTNKHDTVRVRIRDTVTFKKFEIFSTTGMSNLKDCLIF